MIRDVRAREGGDESPSPRPLPVPSLVPSLDVPSVERLRELSEQRVRAQIASAKARRAQQDNTRREFAANRNAGLRSRHAAREARIRLTQLHDEKDTQP